MGFWIPAFAGMTVMQRSPFAGTTEGGRPRGTPLRVEKIGEGLGGWGWLEEGCRKFGIGWGVV